jgi:putative transposase
MDLLLNDRPNGWLQRRGTGDPMIIRVFTGGIVKREFLDFVVPLGERHLRSLLNEWVAHYNQSRPHSSLGPGIPEPANPMPLPSSDRHTLPKGSRVMARPVLGGLHHEYRLEKAAA